MVMLMLIIASPRLQSVCILRRWSSRANVGLRRCRFSYVEGSRLEVLLVLEDDKRATHRAGGSLPCLQLPSQWRFACISSPFPSSALHDWCRRHPFSKGPSASGARNSDAFSPPPPCLPGLR